MNQTSRKIRQLLIIGHIGWIGFVATAVALNPSAEAAHVNVIELDNQIISPVTQQYIDDAIHRSETDGAVCLVLLLDTPGGLLESTRAIVKHIMNAKVPVAVYVAPSGSRAGSAGVFITLAAHVAAMAPSTNIGAAHPVVVGEGSGPVKKLIKRIKRVAQEESASRKKKKPEEAVEEELVQEEETDPMTQKIVNDTVAWITTIAKTRGRNEEWAKKAVTESFSVTETEALKERIVDVVATDVSDLLNQIHGRKVELSGVAVELVTRGASLILMPMTKRQQFLAVVTNPTIAYLLMMLGTLGLIFEFTHPGVGFPGIAGLICIVLALYAFQTLPVSYAAVALIVLGLGLLVAEITIVSHGLLAIGGVISLTLGSLMLFEGPEPSLRVPLNVILPAVATLSMMILFVIQRALRIQRRAPTTGVWGLLGQTGVVSSALAPEGQVFIQGELWQARSLRAVSVGKKVRVTRVEGLQLVVEPLEEGDS